MDQKIKRKWVKALLSGEYKQGRKFLHINGKYCCLGVLHQIRTNEVPGFYWEDTNLGTTTSALLSVEEQNRLAELNDEGIPFDLIAGLIDEAL